MCGMRRVCVVFFALPILALVLAGPVRAQVQNGSVSFTAQLTPSAGIAEPVRGLPFYLLRKSFADIEEEAAHGAPKPDMKKYIDGLKVSHELKAWMHKHNSVTLSGDEFARSLTAPEILDVPEFWKAYDELNISNSKFGFPTPKYNDRLRERDPAKYQRELDDFHSKVTTYIQQNPESKDGMASELDSIDPGLEWRTKVAARAATIRRTALDGAQSRYLVAQTQTDVNGHAEFSGVPAGTYWLSSLNIEGQVGDTRAKWDVPVTVHAGAPTQVTLSNYNSASPVKSAP